VPWELEAIPTRAGQVAWREVDCEVYVFAADGETVHTLSAVAADIWRACDGRNRVKDIADLILASYEVDRATATSDLMECLEALERKGLIGRG
jgi:hypothetical protein